jgi:uncharacterized protein (DUF2235 family)
LLSSKLVEMAGEEYAMKNIVICCDWIHNEIGENISNVLNLYLCLHKREGKSPQQVVYYDPGVGPLARPDPWHKLQNDFSAILGLATGYALDDNVLAAYNFLVRNYEDGDPIYLFGFSRGAFSVRVLAGLIHKVGLIWPDQANLAGSVLSAYKQSLGLGGRDAWLNSLTHSVRSNDERPPIDGNDHAKQLASILSTRLPTIRFVGVFDTVASAIVPRPDRLYLPSLEEPAFTLHNPSVAIFRQAISIDERRSMLRLCKYAEPQVFMRNRPLDEDKGQPQDILQVWFAGAHADIGGGYPEAESAIAKYPLIWMIDEARKFGLTLNEQSVNELAWGIQRKDSPLKQAAPHFTGMIHNSMAAAWHILERMPKSAKYKEWPERKTYFGFYIPDAEPRFIPEDALIHESVVKRMDALSDYRPINLPKRYGTFPMPTAPDERRAF